MNNDQVREMLVMINGFDQRRVVTAETVEAWADLFDRVDPTDALQAVREHYLGVEADQMLMPATIIRKSNEIAARRAEREDAALGKTQVTCGRAACKCTHTGACDAGWIEVAAQGNGNDQVKPCPMCRPEVTSIAASSNSRRHFQTLIRDKGTREEVAAQSAWD